MKFAKTKGFTIIEVLVVVAIIAILTSIIYTSVNKTRAKNRDQRRVTEIHEIQLALEYYFTKNGQYPQILWGEVGGNKTDLKNYLGFVPKISTENDKDAEITFSYIPTSSRENGISCSSYHLYTKLELPSSILVSKRSFDSTDVFVCSGGDGSARIDAGEEPLIYDLRP